MQTATSRCLILAASTAMTLGFSSTLHAFNFSPTKLEYLASSPTCQAALSSHAKNGDYLRSVRPPPTLNKTTKDMIWKTGWWHYCAGRILINRAQVSPNATNKGSLIDDAIGQINFSFEKINRSHPAAVDMAVSLAKVHMISNNYSAADDILESMLELHPSNSTLLSNYALSKYRQKKYKAALKHYELANKSTQGKSAEIVYSLGLTAYRLGDLEKAKVLSNQAKAMGYPLKGLDDLIHSKAPKRSN